MDYFVLKKNNEKEKIILSADIFNVNYNEQLVHQLVVSYIANSHKGIKKQKSRAEVSGGGKKPWKQKGTGRARAGTIRSPLWKGGGKIFAAKAIPSRTKKINKKVYKLGLKVILSQLCRDNKITIIEDIEIKNHKTKNFLNEINFIKKNIQTLLVIDQLNLNIYLATRNIKNFKIVTYKHLTPFLLLKYNSIVLLQSTIKYIEERFK
ncbi:MAG TPA: 50S ribosomal protein L4 [Candidatus Azoamicus sp. OHIO2]